MKSNSPHKEIDKALVSLERESSLTLTANQESLYYLYKLNSKSYTYNTSFAIRIRSSINNELIEEIVERITLKHPFLRMIVCESNGKAYFSINKNKFLDYRVIDASEWNKNSVDDLLSSTHQEPFDIFNGPNLRVVLINRAPKENYLFVSAHHIFWDGWSQKLFLDDFEYFYKNNQTQSIKKELSNEFTDLKYFEIQKRIVGSTSDDKKLFYWKTRLDGILPILELPSDKIRPSIKTYNGKNISFSLGNDYLQLVNRLRLEKSYTNFNILLSAFVLLLNKYSLQDDILVGIPVSGRTNLIFKKVIGNFVNLIAFRSKVDESRTVFDFINETQNNLMRDLRNQDYPFPLVIKSINPTKDLSRSPIFQVSFNSPNFNNYENKSINGGVELDFEPINIPQQEGAYDLSMVVYFLDSKIQIILNYNSDIFNENTMHTFSNHYKTLLKNILLNPYQKISEVEIISDVEKDLIINGFNKTELPYHKNKLLHLIFEEQVSINSDKIAVEFKNDKLTFGELNVLSNRIANHLVKRGVKQGSIVGLMIDRSHYLLAGILGILKAGGAYLPIDPKYPNSRIEYMLSNSLAKILLTEKKYMDKGVSCLELIDIHSIDIVNEDVNNPPYIFSEEQLAYVIYTSGSSGNPKGVMLKHVSVINFIEGMCKEIPFTKEKKIVSVTTISFDIFVLETILPLLKGLTIVIASEEEIIDPQLLAEVINAKKVNMIQTTPSRFELLLKNQTFVKSLANISEIMLGGEAFPDELLKMLRRISVAKIFNVYGPTETTVWSSVNDLTERDHATIGGPIANTQFFIIDKNNLLLPIGMTGELCISGDGLAAGYLNNEELTNNKFVRNPFMEKSKMYKTGDLAKWLPNGEIEFIGRNDNQVKLRGYRIELGEIEKIFSEIDFVTKVVTAVKIDKNGNKVLCAYYQSQKQIEDLDIRKILSKRLPEYMIPTYIQKLEKFPFTPNGKVDRKALPDISQSIHVDNNIISSKTNTEMQLENVWKNVLGLNRIGLHDDYYDLGGYSTLLVELHSKINLIFPGKVSLNDIIEASTIYKQAKLIDLVNSEKRKEIWQVQDTAPEHKLDSLGSEKECTLKKNIEIIDLPNELIQRLHHSDPLIENPFVYFIPIIINIDKFMQRKFTITDIVFEQHCFLNGKNSEFFIKCILIDQQKLLEFCYEDFNFKRVLAQGYFHDLKESNTDLIQNSKDYHKKDDNSMFDIEKLKMIIELHKKSNRDFDLQIVELEESTKTFILEYSLNESLTDKFNSQLTIFKALLCFVNVISTTDYDANYKMKIPDSIEEISIYNEFSTKGYLYIKDLSDLKNPKINIFDINIVNLDKNIVCSMKSLKIFTTELRINATKKYLNLIEKDNLSAKKYIVSQEESVVNADCIVPLQTRGADQPLFLIHAATGSLDVFVEFSKKFSNRPLYGIQSKKISLESGYFDSYEEMASFYIKQIKTIQPQGPYYLLGYSLGGNIAFEMARQLENAREQVNFLGLIDSYCLDAKNSEESHTYNYLQLISSYLMMAEIVTGKNIKFSYIELLKLKNLDECLDYMILKLNQIALIPSNTTRKKIKSYLDIYKNNLECFMKYVPSTQLNAQITYFKAMHESPDYLKKVMSVEFENITNQINFWQKHSKRIINVVGVDGNHLNLLKPPQLNDFILKLNDQLRLSDVIHLSI